MTRPNNRPYGYDPRTSFRIEFNRAAERDMNHVERSSPPRLRRRLIKVDGRLVTAFDAHSLLAYSSEEEMARPGFLYG